MLVLIKSISDKCGEVEVTEVFVDGEKIGEGSYGGEPEDNHRYRDYNWVEPLLQKLAIKLGAEVELLRIDEEEESG
ncbi:hypothetical protein ES703_36815 [subsurface metagenome]